jgi:hypothetical protein
MRNRFSSPRGTVVQVFASVVLVVGAAGCTTSESVLGPISPAPVADFAGVSQGVVTKTGTEVVAATLASSRAGESAARPSSTEGTSRQY